MASDRLQHLRHSTNTMSSQSFSTFQSSSYSSYTDSSGKKYEEKTYSNPEGTTTQRTTQQSGQPAVSESTHVPSKRHVQGSSGEQRVIEDVTDQEEADAKYKERIEDEYAKREGGAWRSVDCINNMLNMASGPFWNVKDGCALYQHAMDWKSCFLNASRPHLSSSVRPTFSPNNLTHYVSWICFWQNDNVGHGVDWPLLFVHC